MQLVIALRQTVGDEVIQASHFDGHTLKLLLLLFMFLFFCLLFIS